jgi:hypothetical protein
MSTCRLDRLFTPRSIAIVGASPREHSLGRHILRNVIDGGFPGRVHLINPDHPEIDGIAAVASIAALPEVPDLAVIAAPRTRGPARGAEPPYNITLGRRFTTSVVGRVLRRRAAAAVPWFRAARPKLRPHPRVRRRHRSAPPAN